MGQGPLTDDEAAEMQLAVEDPQTECKRIFQDAAPASARAIVQISHFGSNERIKLQASLHVIERVLGRVQDNPTKPVDDPYRDMMQDIAGLLTEEAERMRTISDDTEVFDPEEAVRIKPGELTNTHNGLMRDIYKDMGDS